MEFFLCNHPTGCGSWHLVISYMRRSRGSEWLEFRIPDGGDNRSDGVSTVVQKARGIYHNTIEVLRRTIMARRKKVSPSPGHPLNGTGMRSISRRSSSVWSPNLVCEQYWRIQGGGWRRGRAPSVFLEFFFKVLNLISIKCHYPLEKESPCEFHLVKNKKS